MICKRWPKPGSVGQTKTMFGSEYRKCFPNLNPNNCRITSGATPRYNCIAWVVGDICKVWWPIGFSHWPLDIPKEDTIDAFLDMFIRLGYEKCNDGSLEVGCEKIVLYAKSVAGALKPTHAAKQLADGWWTSKLGSAQDIEHEKPEDLCGPVYGSHMLFLRRQSQV